MSISINRSTQAVTSSQTNHSTQKVQAQKPQQKSSLASTFDELKLGERIKNSSVKEVIMGSFMGGIFGAGLAIPAAGIVESMIPKTANAAPIVFSGVIGGVAAGMTTDNPIHGAFVGAGAAATVGTLVGSFAGPKAAIAIGLASAVGGAIGGSMGSITRGRMVDQPPSYSAGMGRVIIGMSRHR